MICMEYMQTFLLRKINEYYDMNKESFTFIRVDVITYPCHKLDVGLANLCW